MTGRRPPSDQVNVIIANRQRVRKINQPLLKKIFITLLEQLEIEKAEIGICLVSVPEMTRLNETFLQHAGSTDVITFDYLAEGRADNSLPAATVVAHGESRPVVHGEIYVCVDEAMVQARRFGTRWQSEVVRYIIHGILHLLGFDDSSPAARRKMKREENRRLQEMTRRFPLSKL